MVENISLLHAICAVLHLEWGKHCKLSKEKQTWKGRLVHAMIWYLENIWEEISILFYVWRCRGSFHVAQECICGSIVFFYIVSCLLFSTVHSKGHSMKLLLITAVALHENIKLSTAVLMNIYLRIWWLWWFHVDSRAWGRQARSWEAGQWTESQVWSHWEERSWKKGSRGKEACRGNSVSQEDQPTTEGTYLACWKAAYLKE